MRNYSKLPIPNRSSGGKRWSAEEDTLLLQLLKRHEKWVDIAKMMNRTLISVQHRFRFLKANPSHASEVEAKVSTRAQDPMLAPDLTCGAPSKVARRLLEMVRKELGIQERKLSASIDGIDLIVGALIRELLAVCYRDVRGGLRVTVSLINTSEHGVGKTAFNSLLNHLEARGLVERTVGAPGSLVLLDPAARRGRIVYIRASSRLRKLCANRGIKEANLLTHFPSLAG